MRGLRGYFPPHFGASRRKFGPKYLLRKSFLAWIWVLGFHVYVYSPVSTGVEPTVVRIAVSLGTTFSSFLSFPLSRLAEKGLFASPCLGRWKKERKEIPSEISSVHQRRTKRGAISEDNAYNTYAARYNKRFVSKICKCFSFIFWLSRQLTDIERPLWRCTLPSQTVVGPERAARLSRLSEPKCSEGNSLEGCRLTIISERGCE